MPTTYQEVRSKNLTEGMVGKIGFEIGYFMGIVETFTGNPAKGLKANPGQAIEHFNERLDSMSDLEKMLLGIALGSVMGGGKIGMLVGGLKTFLKLDVLQEIAKPVTSWLDRQDPQIRATVTASFMSALEKRLPDTILKPADVQKLVSQVQDLAHKR